MVSICDRIPATVTNFLHNFEYHSIQRQWIRWCSVDHRRPFVVKHDVWCAVYIFDYLNKIHHAYWYEYYYLTRQHHFHHRHFNFSLLQKFSNVKLMIYYAIVSRILYNGILLTAACTKLLNFTRWQSLASPCAKVSNSMPKLFMLLITTTEVWPVFMSGKHI